MKKILSPALNGIAAHRSSAFAPLFALGILACTAATAPESVFADGPRVAPSIGNGVPVSATPSATGSAVHWTYEGEDGPEHWGDLSPDYATCAGGQKQSPIDIPAAQVGSAAALEGLEFAYAPAPAQILDNGHTVQVGFPGAQNKVHVDGKDFALVQFHFHAHAEHTIGGGAPDPLELHLVHKAADGTLAVVGVLFKVGAENAALKEVFGRMSSATSTAAELSATINPSMLLPASRKGWAYSGSLTTPPCSEGVKWHLFSTELEVSAEQLAAFADKHGGSFRPALPLNGRLVNNGNLPHWGYEGDEPSEWGDLSPSTGACETGKRQSPIDIPGDVPPAPLAGLVTTYAPASAGIYDNGHTVQVNFNDGANKITLAGKDYKLLQFHFHKHSEHTVGHAAQPLEVHLVHKAADGTLAVLGAFFKDGAANPALADVFQSMPTATDVPRSLPSAFDPSVLLPADRSGWVYDGSLTTPPCSEGVKWHVFSSVQDVSAAQLAAFTHDPSARPTQRIGARVVTGGN